MPIRWFPPPCSVSKYGNPAEDTVCKAGTLVVNKTQKSIELMRWIVRTCSKEQEPILSLFDGTGTATLASVIEGHCAVGLDYSEVMHETAVKRMTEWKKG